MRGSLGTTTDSLRLAVAGRPALAAALAEVPGVEVFDASYDLDVSARVYSAAAVVLEIRAHSPQVDLERLSAMKGETPVLALTAPRLRGEVLARGASGSLAPTAAPEVVVAACRAIDAGLTVFDGDVATLFEVPIAPHESAGTHTLTPREGEVLRLLADGFSNKQIGDRLGVSDHTAKFHVNSIMQKMGAQKRVGAVVKAARLGLIDLDAAPEASPNG